MERYVSILITRLTNSLMPHEWIIAVHSWIGVLHEFVLDNYSNVHMWKVPAAFSTLKLPPGEVVFDTS